MAGKPKHGMSGSRIYRTYHHMVERCFNKNNKKYSIYGEAGITVCEDWIGKNGFVNFYDWAISNGYKENLTLDRIDSKGNYEPSNCRWVDYYVQNNNTSRNRFVEFKGEKHTIGEWSKILDINYNTLNQRIWSGVPVEIALSKKHFKRGEIKSLNDKSNPRIEVVIK